MYTICRHTCNEKLVFKLKNYHEGNSLCLKYDENFNLLFSGSTDNKLKIFNLESFDPYKFQNQNTKLSFQSNHSYFYDTKNVSSNGSSNKIHCNNFYKKINLFTHN